MIDVQKRLAATIAGEGERTLVLANGFCTNAASWDALVATVPRDYRIVRFEYLGNPGTPVESWTSARYATLHGHADDVAELLDRVDARGALFVGHSMSGMVGALAFTRVPNRIAHLVMLSASPRYIDIPGEYEGGFGRAQIDESLAFVDADLAAWMSGFAPAMLGREASEDSIQSYIRHILAMRPDVARALIHSIFESDFRDLLPHVTCRTTVLQCREDAGIPQAVGQYLAKQMPNAELEILDVVGHSPHLTHPQVVVNAMRPVFADFHPPLTT